MTTVPRTAEGPDGTVPPGPSTAAPARADGVTLIGEMVGSGYRTPPALVRRADGQTLQLTPLVYRVLAEVDGVRSYDEVAGRVREATGRPVNGDNVRSLVDGTLRPMGLLVTAAGGQPALRRSNPLLALRFKVAVTDPERTRRLTAPFARLFHPLVVVLVLAAFAGVCWWVFLQKGLASATYEAFDKPGLLLLVLAVTILSAGFHEFGHAAAARRGGATPGVMGAGIYLVWPAFYTDVTDSYRLGRGGRVRTDLGGLYFNALVAVAIAGVWWATGYDALLLVVATQILQMVRQLTPLVRFDGYHVLADVTGVPDLFQRIKPTLLGLLPWRWKHPETRMLKPWARAVVTAWVLVVVPMLAFSLFTMVVTLPRLLGTARTSAGKQWTLAGRAWGDADVLEVAARGVALLAVVFPILAVAVILVRMLRRIGRGTWRATRDRPVRRGLAVVVAAALVAGLVWAWWPRPGAYRPVQPYEGGTLTQAVNQAVDVVRPVVRPRPSGLVEGQYGRTVTAWPRGEARPTQEHPQLALVLVPHGGSPGSGGGAAAGAAPGGGSGEQPWVFPFNRPLAPDAGDNQAMAVNTTDGTIRYDVAFALVWVEDDSPALNTNEAYAFASCNGCAAVAVGFQIVLVTGDNHVAVPQNLSAAVNYDCVNCLTYALATQLFVTLDGPLSEAGQGRIEDIWRDIAAFGSTITTVPLNEIRDRLTAYEQQILAVIEEEQGSLTDPSADPSAEPTASATGASGTASPDAGTTDAAGGTATSGGSSSDPQQQPTGSATGGTATGGGTSSGGPDATSGTTAGTTSGTTSGTSTPSPEPSPTAGGSVSGSGNDDASTTGSPAAEASP